MGQYPARYINGANTYQFVDSSPVRNVDAEGTAHAVLVSGHGTRDVISVGNFWRLVSARIWLTVWHDGFGWIFRGLGVVKAFVGAAVGPFNLGLQLPQSNVGAVHSLGSALWKAVC
jgi:hypothetical protein